jgi:hypothetical protein
VLVPAGVAPWLAQSIPIEGFAKEGVLGALIIALSWLLWQFLKQQRADLLEARADLKAEREAHVQTREATATMLAEATRAMDRMARRRSP